MSVIFVVSNFAKSTDIILPIQQKIEFKLFNCVLNLITISFSTYEEEFKLIE